MNLCDKKYFEEFDYAVSKMLEIHQANEKKKKGSSFNTQEEVVIFSSCFGDYNSFFVKD